jgi:hypothetical protein
MDRTENAINSSSIVSACYRGKSGRFLAKAVFTDSTILALSPVTVLYKHGYCSQGLQSYR